MPSVKTTVLSKCICAGTFDATVGESYIFELPSSKTPMINNILPIFPVRLPSGMFVHYELDLLPFSSSIHELGRNGIAKK